MKNKINSINALLSAFESRNEQLHEEIKKNEEAINEMKEELQELMEDDLESSIGEKKQKMVA